LSRTGELGLAEEADDLIADPEADGVACAIGLSGDRPDWSRLALSSRRWGLSGFWTERFKFSPSCSAYKPQAPLIPRWR
jgi:hypothetical protein